MSFKLYSLYSHFNLGLIFASAEATDTHMTATTFPHCSSVLCMTSHTVPSCPIW